MKKELFEGPVGDYCIARNTIKFLFLMRLLVSPLPVFLLEGFIGLPSVHQSFR